VRSGAAHPATRIAVAKKVPAKRCRILVGKVISARIRAREARGLEAEQRSASG
jgi:hypothetical protein